MAQELVTFPCSVNSIPFSPSVANIRQVDAVANFGQTQYINSLLQWQSKIQYYCKVLSTDNLTFQFKTQINAGMANRARLYVYDSQIGANGSPYPTIGNVVAAFTTPLDSGAEYWGYQEAPYDVYTNPLTDFSQNLGTYMWSFSFESFTSYLTNSGIYFLKFVNTSTDGFSEDVWISEPLLVYGNNAAKSFPTTLLFEGNNQYNKSDIIMDGWIPSPAKRPVFYARVEADILQYEPKGIYRGFEAGNYLQQQTFVQSWETWTLDVGSITNGIPAVMFRIIQKMMELDNLLINNQFYVYDFGNGSDGQSFAWKMKKPRVKGLIGGTLPVRYKYANQFYANPLTDLSRIFTEEFDNTFS